MRKINFRAWSVEEKEMIPAYALAFESYEPLCNLLIDTEYIKFMQFTGLHDKTGKEIYEGDIFSFDDEVWKSSYTSCGTEYDSWNVKNYAVVGFDEKTARFDFVRYKYNENSVEADLHENHDLEFAYFVQELEVIGNIYENPELLGGEENIC